MSIRPLQRINLGLYLLTPILNFGIVLILPFDSRGTLNTRTLLDPAGYAFSIWALIFGGMIWHSWQQLRRPLPVARTAQAVLRRATLGLLVAAIATILFVPVSVYDIPLTGVAVILLHFLPLLVTYIALRALPERPFWRQHWPVSIFWGWICVALVVTISQTLSSLGWNPKVETAQWLALGVLLTVFAIGNFFLHRVQDYLLVLTLAWGLLGIYAAQSGVNRFTATNALSAALILIALTGWYRWRQEPNVVI